MLVILVVTLLSLVVTTHVVGKAGLWSLRSLVSLLIFVGFPVRALVLAAGDGYVFRYIYVPDREIETLSFAALVAQVVLAVGTLAPNQRQLPASSKRSSLRTASAVTPTDHGEARHLSAGRLLSCAYGLTLLQALVLANGDEDGVGAVFVALSRRTLEESSSGVAVNLSYVTMPILVGAIGSITTVRRRTGRSALVLAAFPLLVWFSVVNGRAIVVVLAWAAAMLLVRGQGTRGAVLRLAVVMTATTIATVLLGLAWRTSAQSGQSFAASLSDVVGRAFVVLSDSLPLLDHLVVGMRYADVAGFDHARSAADAFVVLVPRELWPQKPLFMPEVLARSVLYQDISGLPGGLLGEGFVAGAWAGVLLYAFAFGGVVGLLDRIRVAEFVRSRPDVESWLALTAVAVGVVGVRTGLQGALVVAQVCCLALPLILIFVRLAHVGAPKPSSDDLDGFHPRAPSLRREPRGHLSETSPIGK